MPTYTLAKRQSHWRSIPKRCVDKHVNELVCAYDFYDEWGALRFQKGRYRYLNPTAAGRTKTFRYWRGRWGKPVGADALLYRLPDLLAEIRGGAREVWWTEGEKDADTAAGLGLVATSHHGGAPKVQPEQCAWFSGYGGRVRLVVDQDPCGYEDARRRMDGLVQYAGLAPSQMKLLYSPTGGDLTDHYSAGLGHRDWRVMSPEELRQRASTYTAAMGAAYVRPSEEELAAADELLDWLRVALGRELTSEQQDVLERAGYSRSAARMLATKLRGGRR